MARTPEMSFIELITLQKDTPRIIDFLAKSGEFQFFKTGETNLNDVKNENAAKQIFDELQNARAFLSISDNEKNSPLCEIANENDFVNAKTILEKTKELQMKMTESEVALKSARDVYEEFSALANEPLSANAISKMKFLEIKFGTIKPNDFADFKNALSKNAILEKLNDDGFVFVAQARDTAFENDDAFQKFHFVEKKLPENFSGANAETLQNLQNEKCARENENEKLLNERLNFTNENANAIHALLSKFSLSMQIEEMQNALSKTKKTARITGWISHSRVSEIMKKIDTLTNGKIAMREYSPSELPFVSQNEVPVAFHHNKFLAGFERLIFSYGSPLYHSFDATPFVAIFFTLLFGMMFGDCGQGFVIFLLGVLLSKNILRLGAYNKSAPVFIAVGLSGVIMGLLTGEFFTNETILKPFAFFATSFFGPPRAPIVHLMGNTRAMFTMFGVAIVAGFVMNSIGLLLNIANMISRKKFGEAIFGKTGIAGVLFFWWTLALVVRVVAFGAKASAIDFVIIFTSLFFASFGEIFSRLLQHEKPAMVDGFGVAFISSVVELIETISGFLSNTVSFLRVGAFALAHGVLAYVITMLSEMTGTVGGVFVLIFGNALVIALEGMIVAIQVVRLHYYEFFSKFFHETGIEFQPLQFVYKCV